MNCELSREKISVTFDVAQTFLGDGKFSSKNALVTIKDKKGFIKTTNGDFGFSGGFSIENVDAEGEFLLPIEKFMSLLKELPQDKFNLNVEETKIIIKGKKFKYSLPKSDTTFVYLDTDKLKNSFTINSQRLSRIFEKVEFCALKDDSRRNLRAVFIKIDLNETDVVATNSHRLAYKLLDTKSNIKTEQAVKILLPLPTIKNITPLLASDTGNVRVEIFDNLVKFVFDNGFEVVSRHIDESFPDYKKVAQLNMNEHEIVIEKSSLVSALKRIQTVSSQNICNFNYEEKRIVINSQKPDEGEGNEEIDIINKGKVVGTIGYNIHYILDVLRVIETDEVVVRINDVAHPIALKEYNGDDKVVYVIMPVRA